MRPGKRGGGGCAPSFPEQYEHAPRVLYFLHLRSQGFGMPLGNGVAGDLYLRFVVEFPTSEVVASWGPEERKTLEDLLPAKNKCKPEKEVG